MGSNITPEIRDKIYNLIARLNAATDAYNQGKPYMTDFEWDKLYFELVRMENQYNYFSPSSPTQRIYYTTLNELQKVTHNHLMLSLDKTKVDADVANFIFKDNQSAIAMYKCDGLTCSLTYKRGCLVGAETRGNGEVGENILHNALVIGSIPKKIAYKEDLVIDGEIVCLYEDFALFDKKNGGKYENPRNFAAGSIRLLNSEECAKRNLTFVAWDVIQPSTFDFSASLEFLEEQGFFVVPHIRVEQPAEGKEFNVYDILDKIRNNTNKLNKYHSGIPIDGLVFKFDNANYRKMQGRTDHHFKDAIAFKFHDEEAETTLLGIEWSMGRTGQITPIAIFEPVELEGTTVSRANLHNLSIMDELWSHPWHRGMKLTVIKSNQIIPQVIKAEGDPDIKMAYHEGFDNICPCCGESLIIKQENNSKVPFCDNPSCCGKFINQLNHFCGKKGLDIKGLSEATLTKLVDWGWVNNLTDLFKLHHFREDWIDKAGFGERSVDKILAAIDASKENCTLSSFISALGIPLIGKTYANILCEYIDSYEDFREKIKNGYHFDDIKGFGSAINLAIYHFDYTIADELNKHFIYINNAKSEPIIVQNDTLEGLTFVITGKLNTFKNRDALVTEITARGGKVSNSVNKKTSYLINNDKDSMTTKNIAAKTVGIPILSEEDFRTQFDI